MWVAVGTFLGGLGLFLLAMSMITDGLKLAAGNALRGILARFTQTAARGVASGALMTALVQSSSAVTIATIGFVNAGLLSTAQALGVVYGATIGTTMTGWLVALVGLQLSVTTFALPLVGVGMMTRLLGPSRRVGASGEAIAGFGLFFVGIDLLRGAFEGAAAAIDIAALSPEGLVGVLLFAGTGVAMTLLTQSSSAAIAITLTAAAGGLIELQAAAAIVVGATVGTASTAALAVIGATANARRVAAGNVIIHMLLGAVGLLSLPLLSWLVISGAQDSPVVSPALALAAFHTAFSIAGVLLIWPLSRALARFLETRFRTAAEELGRPQHLDSNVLFSPALALDAFVLELRRMADMTRSLAHGAILCDAASVRANGEQQAALRSLVAAVEQFVADLERERMPQAVSAQLPLVLRISNYIDEAVSLAAEQTRYDSHMRSLQKTPLARQIHEFESDLLALIDGTDPWRSGFSVEELQAGYEALFQRWRTLKTELLQAGVDRSVALWNLNPAIESLRSRVRLVERCSRIGIRLAELVANVPSAESRS
jgi:phosphate:Na+ symporter